MAPTWNGQNSTWNGPTWNGQPEVANLKWPNLKWGWARNAKLKSKKNLTKDRNKAFKGTIYFVIHPTFHCPPFDLRSFGTCLYQNFFDIIDTHDSFGLIALLVQLCDMFWTLICSLVHFSPTIWLLNRVLRSPKFGLNFDWTLRQKRLERNEESLLEKGDDDCCCTTKMTTLN